MFSIEKLIKRQLRHSQNSNAASRLHTVEYLNLRNDIQAVGERIAEREFTGGGVRTFEEAGRAQLVNLLLAGLYPHSKLLDIGCGCLRGGYWIINFLNSDCYFGIEPNKEMLEIGKKLLLGDKLLSEKQPRFDNNDQFDLSVFGEKFDFVIARSIWTHASKTQIEEMLDKFLCNSEQRAIFLTSYLEPGFRGKADYKGDGWVGRSHESEKAGTIAHDPTWINKVCEQRGLKICRPNLYEHGNQIWLHISRA